MKDLSPIIIIMSIVAIALGFIFYLLMPKDTVPLSKSFTSIVQNKDNLSQPLTHSVKPVQSNKWYSSVYKSFPSQPIYSLPLAYKLSKDGLGFSFPKLKRTPQTIFATYNEDFSIGTSQSFTSSEITSVGDWSVGIKLKTNTNQSIDFMLAHGAPYTTIHANNQALNLTSISGLTFSQIDNNQTIKSTKIKTASLLIHANNNSYVLFFEKPYDLTLSKNSLTTPPLAKIFIGLINKAESIKEFKNIADSEITGTEVSYSITNGKLFSDYKVYSTKDSSLITLYPHQYDYLTDNPKIIDSYETLRGELRLIKSSAFQTQTNLTTPPSSYKELSSENASIAGQIKKDIAAVIKDKVPESKNYYLGAWFGKISNLILLADTFKLEKEKQSLLSFATPIFIDSLKYYTYDTKQTSLISLKPEFGNEKLNDHHFHYGYFIQAAAVLSRFDLSLPDKIKPRISQMVNDIANLDRSSDKYPFLRSFDIYEGHSWADGYGGFNDGTNQESSSEAINAWYGLYLWSEIVKDTELEKYTLALYNTEIVSTKYYWFDIKNVYKQPYMHKIASIVWGGKVDFSTWFSSEANMKYGIQLLPFSPGSDYLGTLPSFGEYESDFLSNGGKLEDSWGDLFLMWKSYYYPQEAAKQASKVKKFEGNNPEAKFMYFIKRNLEK